jgi:cytochrome c oxidase assembly protein subunit 15
MRTSLQLVNGAILLALVVVLLGGWTRLNDAGLGCPDWPACYGHFILPPAEQVADRIEPHFPGHQVDLGKGWLEMIHRYAASMLGLLILIQAVWNGRQRREPLLSVGLLALVIVQGLFGMWTVTLKLVPWVVTLHLLGGAADACTAGAFAATPAAQELGCRVWLGGTASGGRAAAVGCVRRAVDAGGLDEHQLCRLGL